WRAFEGSRNARSVLECGFGQTGSVPLPLLVPSNQRNYLRTLIYTVFAICFSSVVARDDEQKLHFTRPIEKPAFYSMKLPEGNYNVTVTLGGAGDSETTVKAEARRLMLENVRTTNGQT